MIVGIDHHPLLEKVAQDGVFLARQRRSQVQALLFRIRVWLAQFHTFCASKYPGAAVRTLHALTNPDRPFGQLFALSQSVHVLLSKSNISPDEDRAYSVVDVNCLHEGSFIVPHELVHNLGCQHDRDNTNEKLLTDYGHGWRYCDGDTK